MMNTHNHVKMLHTRRLLGLTMKPAMVGFAVMLILDLMPGLPVRPQPAQAQQNQDEEIVYIDGSGYIRTLDLHQTGAAPIHWVSDEGGFKDVAVGDVNDDGDSEIIGLGWAGETGGKLVVYDPVVNASSMVPDGETAEGVPWKKLYRRVLPIAPGIVGAGDMDTAVAGDEILFTMEASDFASTLMVLTGDRPNPDGTAWLDSIIVNYDHTWSAVAVGQIDGVGADEVVLIDSSITAETRSQLVAYRVDDGGLASDEPFYDHWSGDSAWRYAVIGPVTDGGASDVVAIRSVPAEDETKALRNAFIFQYDDTDGLVEEGTDAFYYNPRPNHVFLANINGVMNGVRDQEVFFLRSVDAVNDPARNPPWLFAVNRGVDVLDEAAIEQTRSGPQDDDWHHGAGGDIDGDGRDELIIMRHDAMRLFEYDADGAESLIQLGQDIAVGTNDESIRAANLDTNGWTSGVLLSAAVTGPRGGVVAGGTGVWSIALDAGGAAVDFSAALQDSPTWVTDFAVGAATTPASIELTVDASDMSPDTYSLTVMVYTTDPDVINAPLAIQIPVEVTPATFNVSPAVAGFAYQPCAAPYEIRSRKLTIAGTTGISYTASIVDASILSAARQQLTGSITHGRLSASGAAMTLYDNRGNATAFSWPVRTASPMEPAAEIEWPTAVPWATARSSVGEIGDILTVTVDPNQLSTGVSGQAAELVIVADERAGEEPENTRTVPIRLLCVQTTIALPIAPNAAAMR